MIHHPIACSQVGAHTSCSIRRSSRCIAGKTTSCSQLIVYHTTNISTQMACLVHLQVLVSQRIVKLHLDHLLVAGDWLVRVFDHADSSCALLDSLSPLLVQRPHGVPNRAVKMLREGPCWPSPVCDGQKGSQPDKLLQPAPVPVLHFLLSRCMSHLGEAQHCVK